VTSGDSAAAVTAVTAKVNTAVVVVVVVVVVGPVSCGSRGGLVETRGKRAATSAAG